MNNEGQQTTDNTDFFKPESPANGTPPPDAPADGISWTASEFMLHQKSSFWYISAIAIMASIGLIYYLLMGRELFGLVAIFVLGALMLVSANRKPRTLNYLVDEHGIIAGKREYAYDDFQSFAIIKEDSIESILLTPQKRWSPALNLYFDPKDGQKIFDVLSTYLPLENRQKDSIDKFLHKIRF